MVTEDKLEDEQFNLGFRSRVGFVFQNSDAQVFSPTVRDEVAFGPLNLGLSTDEVAGRVQDTLDMLDIGDLADRAPYQLSGGQKKRVAIASVLAMNPEVLLFDEPTAALDPRTQQWLIELIVELNTAGKTIVLATHDLETLDVLADRCIVFGEDHRARPTGTGRSSVTATCCSGSTSSTSAAISTTPTTSTSVLQVTATSDLGRPTDKGVSRRAGT